jgi:hypothetical protein
MGRRIEQRRYFQRFRHPPGSDQSIALIRNVYNTLAEEARLALRIIAAADGELVNVCQAAAILGTAPSTIDRWLNDGISPASN